MVKLHKFVTLRTSERSPNLLLECHCHAELSFKPLTKVFKITRIFWAGMLGQGEAKHPELSEKNHRNITRKRKH